MKVTINIMCFLMFLFVFGCHRKNTALLNSAQKVFGNINTAPSVEVENGQAAVLKIQEGYLFVIFHKTDIFNGTYTVLFSKSGDFRKDKKEILRESFDGMPSFEIMGHMLSIIGMSNSSATVQLDGWDESAISIAKFNGIDANTLNISDLKFVANPGVDEHAFNEFMSEVEKEVKKR